MINYADHVIKLVDDDYATDREMLVAALQHMSDYDMAVMLVVNDLPPRPLDDE